LNPDAFEALMFGNAGRTGQLRNLNLAGSKLDVGSFTTTGLSYGISVGGDAKTNSHSAFGVTVKYVLGNVMAKAQDQGTTTGNDVVVNFPIVYTNPDSSLFNGNGIGLD